MCWSVGHQQDGVGLAHHPVSHLNLPGLPVIHSRSHRSHAQSGVVWVVQLPVPKTLITVRGGSTRKTTRRSSHSHVSFHHFAGELCSIVEVLQVGLHLTQCAPHPQQVDVSVSQNRLGSVYGVPADFHHLERRWNGTRFKLMTISLDWTF